MADPTDKDRERARAWAEAEWLNPPPGSDEFVIMESERRGYAHGHAAGRDFGATEERARIVAALRKLETDIERESADHNGDMEGQIYERLIMAGANAVRKAADALERGEL